MISIIVPIYKVEKYIHQCIESIINQTYKDLDIILIDDGSPDNCGEICDKYALKDSRIRVFHTTNKGLSAARNVGIRAAKGEYIGFVDSDDWIDPTMYEELLDNLIRYNADISACGVQVECKKRKRKNVSNEISDTLYTKDEAIRAHIYETFDQYIWNKLYRSSIWGEIMFPEGKNFEDVSVFYRVLLSTSSIVFRSANLYHYRKRENIIANTQSMSNLEEYWFAYYNRFNCLSGLSMVKDDDSLMNKLAEQVANAASKTWRWVYAVPVDERNYAYLKKVSQYIRQNYPAFGRKGWKIYLRVSVFFARYVNSFSFGIVYYLNQVYRYLSNLR